MHVIIFLLSLFIDFIHPYFLEELSLEVVVCFDGCRKRTLEVLCCWFSRQEDYLAKNKSYYITHVLYKVFLKQEVSWEVALP